MPSWVLGIFAIAVILLGIYWLTSFVTLFGKILFIAVVIWIVIEIIRKLLPQRNTDGQ